MSPRVIILSIITRIDVIFHQKQMLLLNVLASQLSCLGKNSGKNSRLTKFELKTIAFKFRRMQIAPPDNLIDMLIMIPSNGILNIFP